MSVPARHRRVPRIAIPPAATTALNWAIPLIPAAWLALRAWECLGGISAGWAYQAPVSILVGTLIWLAGWALGGERSL